MRSRRWLGPIVTLVVVAASLPFLFSEKPARPNVLLVTVDTLRLDRLGCYGGSLRTPSIDRLAREGTLFENAACSVPASRPSLFSMFTSRYPRELGVVGHSLMLPPGISTLAESLRSHGYHTAGFVGARVLGPESGIARGFETFGFPKRWRERGANAVVTEALDWLRHSRRREPFFLWVHLFDPRMPYVPPPPFVPEGPVPLPEGLTGITWDRLLEIADAHGGDLPLPAFERIKALYGGEVEKADKWIGVLLDALRNAGKLDQTIVAFTADHGECFEHGVFFEHYTCMYEGAAHVPLIFRYPPKVSAGQRRNDVVEHVDLAPTLLALAGLPVPPEFSGVALFRASVEHKRFAVLQQPVFPKDWIAGYQDRRRRLRSVAGEPVRPLVLGGERYAVRGDRWKYAVTGDGEELYDLAADPTETRDVAADNPAVLAEMRLALQSWKDANPRCRACSPQQR